MIAALALLAAACGAPPAAPVQQQPPAQTPSTPTPAPSPAPAPRTWDVDTQGIPHLTTHNYIDLGPILRISKFRSGIGHDYWDDFERCRSMKHYFMPPQNSSARDIGVYAPFDGEVVRLIQEFGVQIQMTSKSNPAFTAILFHVNASISLAVGTQLTGGQRIGTHIGPETMSDITIAVDAPGGRRFISWFHTMTDGVFDLYRARGMVSRGDAEITKAERDANPLTCNGEAFVGEGTLPNWFDLR